MAFYVDGTFGSLAGTTRLVLERSEQVACFGFDKRIPVGDSAW